MKVFLWITLSFVGYAYGWWAIPITVGVVTVVHHMFRGLEL